MRKYFIWVGLIGLIASTMAWASERAIPKFDDRKWTLGWSKNENGGVYEEYVLKGETVENWSEMVTVQFFPGLTEKTSLEAFEAKNKMELQKVCPGAQWELIDKGNAERTWAWSVKDCPGQADQSEIDRLARTAGGFHVFHYAIKKSPMPEKKRSFWVKNLKAFAVEEK